MVINEKWISQMAYYKNWEISYRSVIATGGKEKTYTHYCPLDDFFKLLKQSREDLRNRI